MKFWLDLLYCKNVWFYPITEITQSSPRRRDQVDWVSFDILMQFKFSVWSSNWADKLCISDRLIIWLAGLIRGRVAADYIQHNTVRTETRELSSGERDGTYSMSVTVSISLLWWLQIIQDPKPGSYFIYHPLNSWWKNWTPKVASLIFYKTYHLCSECDPSVNRSPPPPGSLLHHNYNCGVIYVPAPAHS